MKKKKRKIKISRLLMVIIIPLIFVVCILAIVDYFKSPFVKIGYSKEAAEVFENYPEIEQDDILNRSFDERFYTITLEKGYDHTNSYKYRDFIESNKEKEISLKDILFCVNKDITFDRYQDYVLNEFSDDRYYIMDNYERYISFKEYSGSEDIRYIVAMVNCDNDYEKYTDVKETDTSKDILMLVNKHYKLSESYEPDDLIEFNKDYGFGLLRKEVYDSYMEMLNDIRKEGLDLFANSNYRSYNGQEEIYQRYYDEVSPEYATAYVARPGFSEHQTGLAVDFISNTNPDLGFAFSEEYKWLKDNAYKYGFIQRYKEDNKVYTGYNEEAWHYRYVGKDAAKYLNEHDITFDEYYEYFIDKGLE